jgi:hypothetical protein
MKWVLLSLGRKIESAGGGYTAFGEEEGNSGRRHRQKSLGDYWPGKALANATEASARAAQGAPLVGAAQGPPAPGRIKNPRECPAHRAR